MSNKKADNIKYDLSWGVSPVGLDDVDHYLVQHHPVGASDWEEEEVRNRTFVTVEVAEGVPCEFHVGAVLQDGRIIWSEVLQFTPDNLPRPQLLEAQPCDPNISELQLKDEDTIPLQDGDGEEAGDRGTPYPAPLTVTEVTPVDVLAELESSVKETLDLG